MKSPAIVSMLSGVSLACLLAACAAQPSSDAASPPSGNASTPGDANVGSAESEMSEVAFACQNGEQVQVRFFPAQGVVVLVRSGNTTELRQQPVASGFLYGNGPVSIRGKGDEMTMQIGRMKPVQCAARRP